MHGRFNPLLFIFLSDFFNVVEKIVNLNYSHGNTHFTTDADSQKVLITLKKALKLCKWNYWNNTIKANLDKYHFLGPSNIESNNSIPAGIYLFKVNNRNTGTRCEKCSKLTIKTLKRRQ